MPKWTTSHTFQVIIGCVMAILTYLVKDPMLGPYAQPVLGVLTLLLGYLGLSSGKAFGGGSSGGGGGTMTDLPGHVSKKDIPPVPPDRVAFSALRKSGVFMIACLALCGCSGCSWFASPQGAQTIRTGVDLAICVLSHSQEPIAQIVTDCGAATAEDVIKILDAHNAAKVREEAAKDGGK